MKGKFAPAMCGERRIATFLDLPTLQEGNIHNKDDDDHDDDYVIYINKLEATRESSIWGIDKGIIVSASEEEGRRRLDWGGEGETS